MAPEDGRFRQPCRGEFDARKDARWCLRGRLRSDMSARLKRGINAAAGDMTGSESKSRCKVDSSWRAAGNRGPLGTVLCLVSECQVLTALAALARQIRSRGPRRRDILGSGRSESLGGGGGGGGCCRAKRRVERCARKRGVKCTATKQETGMYMYAPLQSRRERRVETIHETQPTIGAPMAASQQCVGTISNHQGHAFISHGLRHAGGRRCAASVCVYETGLSFPKDP